MKYYTIDCLDFMRVIKAKNLRVARNVALGRYGKFYVKDVHKSTSNELHWYLSMSGVASLDDVEVFGGGV